MFRLDISSPYLSGGGGILAQESPTLLLQGARNALRPFSVIPSVLGVHKSVPPLGARSFTEIVGDDHYLRILVVWGYGPLKIEDVKIGNTPIEEFEEVVFAMKPGQVSDYFLTSFGYHIAKVYEKIPGRIVPLDESKDKIKEELIKEKQAKALEIFVDRLKEEADIRYCD